MDDGLNVTITFKTDEEQRDEIERARKVVRVGRSAFLRLAAQHYARFVLSTPAIDRKNEGSENEVGK